MKRLKLSSYLLSLCILSMVLSSCRAKMPYFSKKSQTWDQVNPDPKLKVVHTVYLVGDAGDAKHGTEKIVPSLKLLEKDLAGASENSSLIWLGDNIYPFGLPPEEDENRKQAEFRIGVQLDLSENFKGKSYFVPGNHDWNMSQKGGWEAVKREEAWIEKRLGEGSFNPNGGCPGPEVIKIMPGFTMLAIDSEWALHKHEKPFEECGIKDEEGFYFALRDSLVSHHEDILLVTGHHPVYTNGNHGGRYPWGFYAGVITSIYPFGRKLGASRQDKGNSHYRRYAKNLSSMFADFDRLVFAAGHEHSLQHWQDEQTHYLVSGAGCKDSYCSKGHGSLFSHQHTGYMKLMLLENEELWVEIWEPTGVEDGGIMVYRNRLF